MKKTLIKLFLTLGVVILAFGIGILLNQKGGAKEDGTIHFILVDQNGNYVIEDDLAYKARKQDGSRTTLFDILREHYRVACASPTYQRDEKCEAMIFINGTEKGKIILAIEEVETDFFHSFLELYYKPKGATEYKPTTRGVMGVQFADGDSFMFKYVELD